MSQTRAQRVKALAVTAAVVATMLVASAGPAGAVTCSAPQNGRYLGTWEAVSGARGTMTMDITFSGSSVSAVTEWFLGLTVVVPPGTVLTGTLTDCQLVLTGASSGLTAVFSADGKKAVGTFSSSITSGFWRMGRVTDGVSATGTSAATAGGISASDPIGTEVTSPTSGPIAIDEAISTGGSFGSYSLFDTVVRVEAPTATAGTPLDLKFTLDPSATGGKTATEVAVFRNGTLLPACTVAPQAGPDPCVSQREDLAGGGVRLTVLTSQASSWNFGASGTCAAPQNGRYLGTWVADSPAGARGALVANLTFSGSVVTGFYEFVTGAGTLVPPGTALAGSRIACDLVFSSQTTTLTGTANGVLSIDGTEVAGTFVNDYPANGTWRIGRVTDSVSATGTSAATAGGISASDPIGTGVTSPTSGPIVIDEAISTGGSFANYSLFDTVVRIEAPAATATTPLQLVFTLDPSATGGKTAAQVAVFRNGALLPGCTGAPQAIPDPCVSQREDLAGGGVRLTVLTSQASTWNFGALATVPGAPTIGTATPGNGQATLSWTAPASDGGSPVTGYEVTPYIGYFPLTPVVFSSTATTQTVTGLVNGTQYRFLVRAINDVGTGDYSTASNAVVPGAPAPLPVVKFGSGQTKAVVEGNSGTTPVSVNVNLIGSSAVPVTVFWSTMHGTAKSRDYTGGFGWLTFAPGETTKTITVSVNGDLTIEPDEVFTLNLSDPVNAQLGAASKPIQITNDD